MLENYLFIRVKHDKSVSMKSKGLFGRFAFVGREKGNNKKAKRFSEGSTSRGVKKKRKKGKKITRKM